MGLKRSPCDKSHLRELYNNTLLDQGCLKETYKDYFGRGVATDAKSWDGLWPKPLKHICERAYAIEAMQFVILGLSVALLALGFLMLKKKGEKLSLTSWP